MTISWKLFEGLLKCVFPTNERRLLYFSFKYVKLCSTVPDGAEVGATPYAVLTQSLQVNDRTNNIIVTFPVGEPTRSLGLFRKCVGAFKNRNLPFCMGFPWEFLKKIAWDCARTFMGGRGH